MTTTIDIIINGIDGKNGNLGVDGLNGPKGDNGINGKKKWFKFYIPATNGKSGKNAIGDGGNGGNGQKAAASSFFLTVTSFKLSSALVITNKGGNGGSGGKGGSGGNGGTGGDGGQNIDSRGKPTIGGKGGNGTNAGNGGIPAIGGTGGAINVIYVSSNMKEPVLANSVGGTGGIGGTAGAQGMGGKGGRNEDGRFQPNGINGKQGKGQLSAQRGEGSDDVHVTKVG